MRQFLPALRRCFTKNGFLLGLLVLVSAGGLFFVFWMGWSMHPLAPVLYALSAYTLAAGILYVISHLPAWRCWVQSRAAVQHWRENPQFRRHVRLYRSFWIGLLLVCYKLIAGLRYRSSWLIAMAFYYSVLSVQRGLLLCAERGNAGRLREDSAFVACGWLMLLLAMAIFGMRVLLFRDGERIVYPGHMIYAVALYSFYSMTMAILHTVRRRSRDIMPKAYRRIHLITAMVSLLFLQTALLSAFSDNAAAASYANLATGSAVAWITMILGISMIVRRSAKDG